MTNQISKEVSLTESVYRALRTALVFGHIEPGSRLKTGPISQKYGVSLAAVREALTRLSVRDAAADVAARTGQHKRTVYARALELAREEKAK